MFDGVRAAVGEEHVIQIAGGAFGDQPGRLGPGGVGMLRRDSAQLGGLLGDGRDHLRMLVADIGEDQLPGEVQEPVACTVPDIGALGRDDRHRGDLRLRRPGVEHVGPVELVRPGSFGAGGFEVQAVGQGGLGGGHVAQCYDRSATHRVPFAPESSASAAARATDRPRFGHG